MIRRWLSAFGRWLLAQHCMAFGHTLPTGSATCAVCDATVKPCPDCGTLLAVGTKCHECD